MGRELLYRRGLLQLLYPLTLLHFTLRMRGSRSFLFSQTATAALSKNKKHLKNVGPIHQVSSAVLSRAACASMSTTPTTTTTTTTRDRGDMEWAQKTREDWTTVDSWLPFNEQWHRARDGRSHRVVYIMCAVYFTAPCTSHFSPHHTTVQQALSPPRPLTAMS